jgi:hypothetical protein
VNVPALAAGTEDWIHIDAKGLLPNNVSLKSTTFRLNVDATEIVPEADEANNEIWHNQGLTITHPERKDSVASNKVQWRLLDN